MIVGTRCSRPKEYEFERTCWAEGKKEWTERVVVVRSPRHAAQQAAGLATRLSQAENPRGLDAPRGRGKRQIRRRSSARGGH